MLKHRFEFTNYILNFFYNVGYLFISNSSGSRIVVVVAVVIVVIVE